MQEKVIILVLRERLARTSWFRLVLHVRPQQLSISHPSVATYV